MNSVQPELWTARDLAKAMRLGVRSVWKLLAAERLPEPLRLGGRMVRWRRSEILDWLDAGCPARDEWVRVRGSGDSRAQE